MGIGPEDVNIAVIPLSHSYGLGNLVMPLVLQGSPLLLVAAPLPELLREALSQEAPTVFPGVPILFDNLANLPGIGFLVKGLRLCISAGAPLRRGVAAAFRARYRVPVRAFYGASECGGITFDASPGGDAAEELEGCVGSALPGVQVRLEGEEGRVAVRSDAVASGYVPRAAAGEEAFAGNLFRTGDTARLDSGGRLTLTGRAGSLVNVAGRKVNPREVESALMAIPGVGDAAVVGVPDAARGESLVACLVAGPGVTRKQLMDRLRLDLADYKLPRKIVFVETIPRNDRGKVARETILRMVNSSRERNLRPQVPEG
jgi:acyl-CoA synthetase (AMP-forming)/AMP-acid ligase II